MGAYMFLYIPQLAYQKGRILALLPLYLPKTPITKAPIGTKAPLIVQNALYSTTYRGAYGVPMWGAYGVPTPKKRPKLVKKASKQSALLL